MSWGRRRVCGSRALHRDESSDLRHPYLPGLGYRSLGWNRIGWLVDRRSVDWGGTGWGCSRVARRWLVGGSRVGNGCRRGAIGIGLGPGSALFLLALEECLELVHCADGCD